MRERRAFACALLAVVVVACAGSDEGPTPATGAPDATFATVPPATTDPATATSAAPDSAPATTEPLEPSPEADLPTAPPASDPPPPSTVPGPLPLPTVELVEIGTFERPLDVAVRPLDVRAFVVEQVGRIHAVDDLAAEIVLDLTDTVLVGGEQGLLGLAFHPDQDLAYVHYTASDGSSVVSEFAIDPVSAVFDAESERTILVVEQPFPNHNGGQLAFGPDRMLYVGLGDGGAANDPLRASLDLSSPLGKILRIDPLGVGDGAFTVPPDNPFVDVEGADPTIWSLGLRNPWKFSFDALTGDLWIADVGQNEIEEATRAPATAGRRAGRGLSFGWSAFEGTARFNEDQPADGHTPPTFEYTHADGNCSISGGVVARDSAVDDLDGWYLYGDFCSGTIWGYDTTSPATEPRIVELAALSQLAAVAAGPEGEIYAVSQNGTVARFAGA